MIQRLRRRKENHTNLSSIHLLADKLGAKHKLDIQQTDCKTTSTKGNTCRHYSYIENGENCGVDSRASAILRNPCSIHEPLRCADLLVEAEGELGHNRRRKQLHLPERIEKIIS